MNLTMTTSPPYISHTAHYSLGLRRGHSHCERETTLRAGPSTQPEHMGMLKSAQHCVEKSRNRPADCVHAYRDAINGAVLPEYR